MAEIDIVTLARRQHGLITRAQAEALGVSDRMIERRTRSGAWERIRPGVFSVGAAPSTWLQAVHAACLAAGPDAAASHRTAARMWELVDRSGRIEILIDSHRRVRLPGVTVHRSILLPRQDLTVLDAVPITVPARTLVDLAPSHGTKVMGRWIDTCLRDLDLQTEVLAACCSRLSVSGRPAPLSVMRALAKREPGHDPGRSALESRAIAALADAGLPPPVRQHPVRRPTGTMAFIDLAYPQWMIAVELDGWATHGVRWAFEPDRLRGNDLALLGWSTLRFTWSMTDDYLCRTVAAAIAAATR